MILIEARLVLHFVLININLGILILFVHTVFTHCDFHLAVIATPNIDPLKNIFKKKFLKIGAVVFELCFFLGKEG